MNKDLLNIVITGGPCGGKTTALDELTKLLRSYGYYVLIVPETATEMKNNGILPYGPNGLSTKDFQEILLDIQLSKEKYFREAAKRCPSKKVAILYDRGVLDNRAYIDDATFQEFLKARGISEAEILSSYDIVFHLVTAANGKEEYYTLENNTARSETPAEARERDVKTMETWRNHPNLRIVGNDTLFGEKINKVKNYIREYLGEEKVVKKERYLVKLNDFSQLFNNKDAVREEIESFVVYNFESYNDMYSKSTINGSNYYTCTTNVIEMDGITKSVCRTITKQEYELAESKNRGLLLKKTRYNFIYNNERYRYDMYNLYGEFFNVLERDVAFTAIHELPPFIHVIEDITNNPDYNDDSLCTDYNINYVYNKRK